MSRGCSLFILSSILWLAVPFALIAQTAQPWSQDSLTPSIFEAGELYHPLLYTDNVAALWFTPIQQMGNSQATLRASDGKFRRPQQAVANRALHLSTERYQRTNSALWYGKFAFEQSTDKDIHWNSVLDPYRGTPYILADSIGGDWKKQQYSLQAKVAARPLWRERLHPAFDLSYDLATGAKQIDPRPLSNTNTLKFGPSMLWLINTKQQIGFSAHYQIFKENINIEIRQPNTAHNLYRFKGLSIHDNSIPTTSGHSREYVGQELDGALQHQITWNGNTTLTSSLGYAQYRESTTDGSTMPSPAGDYKRSSLYATSSLSRKADGRLDQLVVKAFQQNNEGTEYHTTYDHTLGQYVVSFSGALYAQEKQALSLRYNLGHFTPGNDIHQLFYVDVAIDHMETTYRYTQPSTQQILQLRYTGGFWYNIPERWRFQSEIGYQHSPSESLYYTPKAGLNTAAQEVLFPDHDYLMSTSAHIALQAKRLFTFLSTKRTQWYIHAQALYQQRLDEVTYSDYGANRYHIQLGFGAYY